MIVDERLGNGKPTDIGNMMRIGWWWAMRMRSIFLLVREVAALAVTRSGRR